MQLGITLIERTHHALRMRGNGRRFAEKIALAALMIERAAEWHARDDDEIVIHQSSFTAWRRSC